MSGAVRPLLPLWNTHSGQKLCLRNDLRKNLLPEFPGRQSAIELPPISFNSLDVLKRLRSQASRGTLQPDQSTVGPITWANQNGQKADSWMVPLLGLLCSAKT